ncbi:MAG: hypothetical protein ACREHD_26955 [Pirellulales bacterium]
MPMTFDATLKDLAREHPLGFLSEFYRPPTLPIQLLNVDLSAVTRAADFVVALGDPPIEVVDLEFQSSAAAWKHADVLVYNALLFAMFHVPVHSVVILLRPEAAHPNLSGNLRYETASGSGSMDFRYPVVRLWERPAESLLTADIGVMPLAVLGRLPEQVPLEEALASVAQRMVERLTKEASAEEAKKLLTQSLLLTGLRVRRNVALKIFRGVRLMEESDTYLMILEQGEERARREDIFEAAEIRLGGCDEATRAELTSVTDLARLKRMFRRALVATSWREILDTL